MDPLIAVTGSTGRLGGQVAALLAAAGSQQRLVVRDPTRAPQLDRATVRQAAYHQGEASRQALQGAGTLLMVSAAESPHRVAEHACFIEAAVAAGVGHIVYTSFLAAARDATFTHGRDHWATEQLLIDSGVAWTVLRDNFYADIFTDFVGDDGAIRGPAGEGSVSAVAIADVAAVAAAVLSEPGAHTGAVYDLTGPQALTLTQIAESISAVTGQQVRYEPESLEEAHASRAGYGAEDYLVEAWVSTYTSIAAGELAAVSPHVSELLGRPATTLEQVLAQSVQTNVTG